MSEAETPKNDLNIKHYTLDPSGGGKPKSLVILLHGLGADGKDLMGLVPYFAAQMPDTVFVAPDAPFPCDMAPMGYQWFSLQNRDPDVMLSEVHKAAPIVNAFIDSQLDAHNLTPDKCVVLGFSQGTMVALYTAPRRDKPLAGVLGYSGVLLGAEDLKESALSKFPVHLIHGNEDDVVPYAAMEPAAGVLNEAGFKCEVTTCEGLGHGIDEAGLETGLVFLKRVL